MSYRPIYNTKPWKKLYATKEWQSLRAHKLRADPLCRYCLDAGIATPAEVVDHIEPHKGNTRLFYDGSNLQSLCKKHHDSAKQRFEKTGNMIGCKPDGSPIDTKHHWNG